MALALVVRRARKGAPQERLAAFSLQPEDDDGTGVWWVHAERAGLPMSRERQRRGGEVGQDAVLGVHEVLAGASDISHLGWHHEALER